MMQNQNKAIGNYLSQPNSLKITPYERDQMIMTIQYLHKRKDGYKTATLMVQRGQETREIGHFWFDSWPDYGVPQDLVVVPKMLKVHTDTVSESAAEAVYALMSATRCISLPYRFTQFSIPKGHT